MKGAVVFLAVFAIVLVLSLGYAALPPGRQLYDAIGGLDLDYSILGISVSTLVPACFNGIIYGIIAWVLYSIASRKSTEQVAVQVDVTAQARADQVKEREVRTQMATPQASEGEDQRNEGGMQSRATLEEIEGIGPTYAKRLGDVGIQTPAQLLKAGATPKGRQELADQTGISGKLILEWVNAADLFRIKGVGQEYADLLEEAGVDTVVELANRNPGNLHAKILEVNEAQNLVRRPPSVNQVKAWIEQAKKLPRRVEY